MVRSVRSLSRVVTLGDALLLALAASAAVATGAGRPPGIAGTAVPALQPVAVMTIAVGADPTGVAVDPGTHLIYVTNQGDNTVSVIDDSTGRMTATISVGRNPTAVAVDPKLRRVFVANHGAGSVSVIDATTNQVTATIATGVRPSDIVADPVTDRLYVADGDEVRYGNTSGTVRAIDGRSGRVVVAAPVDGLGSVIGGLAVDPSTNSVYVPYAVRSNPPVILMLDGTTLRTLAGNGGSTAIYRGTAAGSFGVAVDPVTHRVFATSPTGFPVAIFDGTSPAAFGRAPVTADVGASPVGVTVDPTTGTAYVAQSGRYWGRAADRDAVSVLDEATGRVVASVNVGMEPWGIAVDPGNHLVYVANHLGHSVTVIAGVNRPAAAAPAPGEHPRSLPMGAARSP